MHILIRFLNNVRRRLIDHYYYSIENKYRALPASIFDLLPTYSNLYKGHNSQNFVELYALCVKLGKYRYLISPNHIEF